MLMRRRGVHVVKGEEGALSMTTRERFGNSSKGFPVNYCSGLRSLSYPFVSEADGVSRESFSVEVNAKDYGFEPTDTPRTDRSVLRIIELGLAAVRGEKGPAYDRIVLNTGMVDHLLGCDGAEDISSALIAKFTTISKLVKLTTLALRASNINILSLISSKGSCLPASYRLPPISLIAKFPTIFKLGCLL